MRIIVLTRVFCLFISLGSDRAFQFPWHWSIFGALELWICGDLSILVWLCLTSQSVSVINYFIQTHVVLCNISWLFVPVKLLYFLWLCSFINFYCICFRCVMYNSVSVILWLILFTVYDKFLPIINKSNNNPLFWTIWADVCVCLGTYLSIWIV